jgi:aspartate dehydrogenase
VAAASVGTSSPSASDVRVTELLLIGCGAMGRQVMRDLRDDPRVRVSCVLEESTRCAEVRRQLGDSVRVVSSVEDLPLKPDFALECAGHRAVQTAVVAILRSGIDVIVASVGALAEPGLPEMLEQSALAGKSHVTLIPGAIAGIDALSAASARRLDAVSYMGRKPPHAWAGTPAERDFELNNLDQATTIFSGNARAAARTYPKNANVAAMVALAGIGFERTEVTLVADPQVTGTTHSIHARGQFGELQRTVSAHPLAENPKTSELAALSVLRAVRNRLSPVIV